MGHLPVILLETRELCLPCSVVFPLQAKVEPPKMPAAIPPISHGTHIPGPPPHPSSVSAAPNTYSSTCIRSKDDPTRGSQDFKNSSRSQRRSALLLRRLWYTCSRQEDGKSPFPWHANLEEQIIQDITFPSGSVQQNHWDKEPFNAIKTT